MESQKKALAVLGIIILILALFVVSQQYGSHLLATLYYPSQDKNKESQLIVAGCPTFHYMLDVLNDNGINIIKTNSTAESFYYLQKGDADLIISGRVLKPEEPYFSFEIFGPGYSFISDRELFMIDRKMGDYSFFTDFPAKEMMERFPYINSEKILEVENVYDYLSEGIIITSAENTDYSKSEIVHVYKEDGYRHRFSRTPIIYYSDDLNNLNYIKNILDENRVFY